MPDVIQVRKNYAVLHVALSLDIHEQTSVALQFADDRRVTLRPGEPGQTLPGGEAVAYICEAFATVQVTPRRKELLDQLARGEMPAGSKQLVPNPQSAFPDTEKESFARFADESGNLLPGALPPFEFLPDKMKAFIREEEERLFALADRGLRVLRWRAGLSGTLNVLRPYASLEWSNDGSTWHAVPAETTISVSGHVVPAITEAIRTSVEVLVNQDLDEPLGHELHREASDLRGQNPRAALLTLVTAAEVAVKQCITLLEPNTEWMVLNMPSPDIPKVLSEYLPQLPVRESFDGQAFIPKAVLDELRKAIEARNRLAHRGALAPDRESLDRKFQAVSDLLWLLDFYSGHAWAIQHVSEETRGTLPSVS